MLSGEEFYLKYDSGLDLYQTTPVPTDLQKYYNSSEYISHTDSALSIKDRIYQGVKRFQFRQKLARLLKYNSGTSRILDVGTGTGDWPLFLKSKGHAAIGIETNTVALKRAQEKGVEVYEGWQGLEGEQFDCITLWHVLEHLQDPQGSLIEMLKYLKPGGILFIAVPNFKSFDAKYYKENWAAYDVPRHLWHFSAASIRLMGEKAGFVWERKYPMWFDTFYVSLLSETYRKESSSIRAIGVACCSTISALFSKEHSSMLYVLRKPQKEHFKDV